MLLFFNNIMILYYCMIIIITVTITIIFVQTMNCCQFFCSSIYNNLYTNKVNIVMSATSDKLRVSNSFQIYEADKLALLKSCFKKVIGYVQY